jgi:hypothetical protein
VIIYIWTAPGGGAAGIRRATGVSDNQTRAREAAEAALRTAQAATACIERVHTELAVSALSLCYVRTGTGWRAQVGQTGGIVWTPFTTAREATSREEADA